MESDELEHRVHERPAEDGRFGLLLINKIIPNTSLNAENVLKASDFVTIPKHWNTKSTVFTSLKGDL